MPVTTSTKAISKTLLDKETDARFWAQTGYKPGQKLDPKDPTDRIMTKLWLDTYAKVKAEDAAGKLVVTYNHPAVEQHLNDATLAFHAVDAHLDAAVRAPDPATSQQYVNAAASAATAANGSTQAAAMYQPATVSPIVALATAQEVAHSTGLPAPETTVHDLPPDHPAQSPAAQPALHPEMVSAPVLSPDHPTHQNNLPHTYVHPDGSSVVTYDHEIHGPHAAHEDPSLANARAKQKRRHREQLSIAHAMATPTVAIAVHEAEQERMAQGAPPPTSTISSQTIAQLRDRAGSMAGGSTSDVIGVIASTTGEWSATTFPTASEAADWYGAAHDRGGFAYLAYFDRHDQAWPGPVNEDVGAGSLDVRVSVDRPPALRERERERVVTETKTNYIAIAAVGVAAVGGLLALMAVNNKRGNRA
jgi:hypothetical protein